MMRPEAGVKPRALYHPVATRNITLVNVLVIDGGTTTGSLHGLPLRPPVLQPSWLHGTCASHASGLPSQRGGPHELQQRRSARLPSDFAKARQQSWQNGRH